MGRRGPKPEPAAVKVAKGNPSRRPVGTDPDVQATGGPVERVAPPFWLKGEGRKVWDRIAPKLIGLKLLTSTDAETFARYCANFAKWLKMQKVLDKEGETYESESAHGKLKRAHPAYMIGDRLERLLQSAEDRFGLNPADRQRIFAARAAGASAPGDLFDNGGGDQTEGEGDKTPRRSAVGWLQ